MKQKAIEQINSLLKRVNVQPLIKRWHSLDNGTWEKKMLTLLIALGVFVLFAGPISLLSRDSLQLQTESLDRGRALVKLLAASNQQAFIQEQEVLYSIDSVKSEAGVRGAYVADDDGIIVSPVNLFGKEVGDVKNFKQVYFTGSGNELKVYEIGSGKYFLTYPIFVSEESAKGIENVKKGVACLHYDARASLNRVSHRIIEILRFMILLSFAMWGVFILLKRWTLLPILKAGEIVQAPLTKEAAVQGKGYDLKKVWEKLGSVNAGDFVVLDSKKNLIEALGSVDQALKCSLSRGQHLLEALNDSPYLKDVLNLLVQIDRDKESAAELKLPNGVTLKAVYLDMDEGYYILVASR